MKFQHGQREMDSARTALKCDVSTPEERLIADRARTLERIAALSGDWDGIVEASAQVGVDDEHDPEGATLAFERTQVEASLSRARAHLADLDDALRGIRDGTYGACVRCGGPIGAERLAARPTARTCITCAAGP
jgi:DnaK suppressor protein